MKKIIGKIAKIFKKQKPKQQSDYDIILIDIENNTEEAKEFDLFGAYVNVFNIEDGILNSNGVTIKNPILIDGYGSYGDILWKSIKEEICISKSQLIIFSGICKGFFKIITSLPNGTKYERTLLYYQDPYQSVKEISQNNEEIKVDGFTKIIGKLEPKSKIRLTLFVKK